MLKHLSPTGSPIKLFELVSWFYSALSGSGDRAKLQNMVKRLLNREYSFLYSTGRGAMTELLSAVKALHGKHGERNEVILPAYTCYSVASSAINAGLKIRLCDIDPQTLSYDLQKLREIDFSRVAAIVSANLYGLPNDLGALERVAMEHGVLLIDDAAQSLNSKIDGRHVGTYGYAGILSLDKGKNVTSMQGGLIVTNDSELAEYLDKASEQLSDLSSKSKFIEFVKVFVYFLFLNPYAYKIPANISFSGLGETRFETEVEVKAYPEFLSSLAIAQFDRVELITESRVSRGEFYEQTLNPGSGVSKIAKLESTEPVYLRYPILVHDGDLRSDLLTQYRQYGISASYPEPLNLLSEIEAHLVTREACPGAERVAREIVTLPTHAFVTDNDAKRICEIVNKL